MSHNITDGDVRSDYFRDIVGWINGILCTILYIVSILVVACLLKVLMLINKVGMKCVLEKLEFKLQLASFS